ncbi:MAG: hypothetical protein ACJ8CR_33490 [Roseiflexaceae bacterium]
MRQHTQMIESLPAAPIQSAGVWFDLRSALRRAWAVNWSLTLLGLTMLALLLVSLAGLVLDPRMITGAPAWLKPMKFAISIALYSFTLLWLLTFVQGHPRLVRVVSVVTMASFVVETVIVVVQVVRGTTSHFNHSTPLDETLFNLMGLFVILIWLMNLLAAILLIVQRLPDLAFAWALRLGLLLTLIGAASGVLMTQPTPRQLAALQADQPVSVIGAHSVGVADGGPGLPVTGWSTIGGDLRVGHFAGLHALQAMPLVGWLLRRRRARRLGDGHRTALTWIAGLGYLGLILLLIWQALRGQPLLAPDATTLAALGALFGAAALAALAVLAHARGRAGAHVL